MEKVFYYLLFIINIYIIVISICIILYSLIDINH